MRKAAGMLAFSLLGVAAVSAEAGNRPVLDKVVFQVSAKQWVTTQTALLTVNVNAALTDSDLVKTRAAIMGKLAKIAAGEWHITQFERSQDSSGLEKLFVEAQLRVPQANLTNVYQSAKDVSKPGATYTIASIEFKPGLEDVEQIKNQLREKLYRQVNDEIARLNKVYTTQQYSVNRLYIIDGQPQGQPKNYQPREMKTMVMAAVPAPAPMAVSNELVMSAMVEAASNRQGSGSVANQ
ncbi:hypothetical protein ACFORL_01820 [Legionella dresdenensis]|uniref:DUF541 domain-containing protein n=1 Tax=Legionella dresdenensis TaxID=450200 RepID=A0ABV8CC00_9GAMM